MNKTATGPEGNSSYKEWSREDLIACILSSLSYLLITAGLPLLLLNQLTGWLLMILGLVSALVMFYIINPKLKLISGEFEKKQKTYLEELDKIIGWESNSDSES